MKTVAVNAIGAATPINNIAKGNNNIQKMQQQQQSLIYFPNRQGANSIPPAKDKTKPPIQRINRPTRNSGNRIIKHNKERAALGFGTCSTYL